MASKGHSDPNFWGGYTHYDDKENKIGHSEPNFFGGYTNYDAKGNKVGTSDPNLFGGYTQRDNHGHKVGESDPNFFGGYTHRDVRGNEVGESDPNFLGGYRNTNDTQGCYIATCVYGSYDCPQVWVLRRFRDNTLARTALGRTFIHVYYAVSPRMVKAFGTRHWFRKTWQILLDRMVGDLRRKGVPDGPYQDPRW